MKYLNLTIAAALILLLATCKKDEGPSDSDKSTFIKSFGTSSEGVDLVQTDDGGYVILGTTQGVSSIDIYLQKVDAFGNPQWSKTYDGPLGGTDESAYDLELMNDGGFAISGSTFTLDTTLGTIQLQSTYLIITDYIGTQTFAKAYNSGISINVQDETNEHEQGFGLTITPSGNILIASTGTIIRKADDVIFNVGKLRLIEVGTFNETVVVADLSTATGDGNSIGFRDVIITTTGEVLVTGFTTQEEGASTSQNLGVAALVEDSTGEFAFTKAVVIGGAEDDIGYRLLENSKGEIVVYGFTTTSSQTDMLVLEIDFFALSPAATWQYTSQLSVDDECNSVLEVSGGYVLVGFNESGDDRQMYIVKINTTGSAVLWNQDYGYVGFDEARAVIATADNGIAVLGTSSDERGNRVITLLKLDANGNLK